MLRDVSYLVNEDFHHYQRIKFPADKNKFLEFSIRPHRLDPRVDPTRGDSSGQRYFVDGNITNTSGRIGPLANAGLSRLAALFHVIGSVSVRSNCYEQVLIYHAEQCVLEPQRTSSIIGRFDANRRRRRPDSDRTLLLLGSTRP